MQLRRPEHPERVAIVVIGLLVVANLAWFGYRSQDTSTASRDRPDSVAQVFPSEDAVIRPQDTVGFDLRDDLHGALEIDRERIPEDQYTGDKGVGQVLWRPGDGQAFKELPEGRHAATAVFWDASKTEAAAREAKGVYTYTWRFTVAA